MMKTLVLPVLMVSFFSACNCVEGEGPMNSKEFSIDEIRGFHIEGSTDVKLKQGSPQEIRFTAQQNILELMQITVNDGIAYISTSSCYQTDKQDYLEITIPRLEELTLLGAGDITSEGRFMLTELDLELDGAGNIVLDVDAAEVNADLNGAGDISLTGESKELNIDLNGAGDVLASKLKSENVEADLNGAGSIEVHASESLDASINGAGDIRYTGKPEVKSNVSGSGSVSPM